MNNQSEAEKVIEELYTKHQKFVMGANSHKGEIKTLKDFYKETIQPALQKQIDRADELIKIIRNKDEWTDACEEKIKELKTRAEILKTKNEITHKRMMELIDREEDYLKEIKELKARAESAEHDIEAYRGGLGYSVRGDHSGMLKNGQFPFNGIADAKEKEISRLKAENEKLKEEVNHWKEHYYNDDEKGRDLRKLKSHADKLAEALEECDRIRHEIRMEHLADVSEMDDLYYTIKKSLQAHAEFKDRKEKE